MSRLSAVVLALALASCESGPHALAWRFFVDDADAAALGERIDVIEARILAGGCDGTDVLFETELVLGDGAQGVMAMQPDLLGPGTYGIAGRAHDERCIYFLSGCTTITLPAGASTVDVPLTPAPQTNACEPGDPGAGDVTFDVGTRDPLRAISPWIYGVDDPNDTERTLATLHGSNNNRWSTHDWETGASNGGDYFGWSNDLSLGGGDGPAPAVTALLGGAREHDAAALIPLSLMARVAADANQDGDVRSAADFYDTRFIPSVFARGAPFPDTPDLTDGVVYQDELVHYVERGPLARCADCARDVIWSLDLEVDEWRFSYTDLPEGMAFSESDLFSRSIELAAAVRAVDPGAIIVGPWVGGYASLPALYGGGGPDQPVGLADRYAHAFFDALAARRETLLDAFATGYKSELPGVSAFEPGDASVIEARMHAARMLWDRDYEDGSWITTDFLGGPLYLIPRLREAVRVWLPNCGIAIPRWNLGGDDHISGAIAAADALGVFGREDGVVLAALSSSDRPRPYIDAAFAMYRDYDGLGSTFGDLSMPATTSDGERTAIYASTFASAPERVVLVAINRSADPVDAAIRVTHRRRLRTAEVYALTDASATPARTQMIDLDVPNALVVTLPGHSVVTIALR